MKYRVFGRMLGFIMLSLLMIAGMLGLVFPALGGTSMTGKAMAPHYTELLVPTADVVLRPTSDVYFLILPAGGIGQISFPVTRWVTTSLYGGVFGYPQGFFGSAYLRVHLLRPNATRWGLALQTQSGMAVAFPGGEGNGGAVSGIAIVVSSPMRPTRVSFGTALHTMPGSEFKPGWEKAKNYDFRNPQPTFFLSGGHTLRRVSVFTEVLWIAPDADDGWDSLIAGLIGSGFSFGRTNLKVGTGLLLRKPGTMSLSTLPVPPVVALTTRF